MSMRTTICTTLFSTLILPCLAAQEGVAEGDARRQPVEPDEASAKVDAIDRQFRELFDQLEQRFGIEVPRERFFDSGFIDRLRRQVRPSAPLLQQFEGPGSAMTMSVGEDGVRVVIREKQADGSTDEQVYEAPDLQSFTRQYPEVAERVGLDTVADPDPSSLLVPSEDPWSGFELIPRGSAREPQSVPEGERLGVMVRRGLSEDLRRFLGLDGGVGLMVSDVVDGSLGAKLGLEPDDVILSIGGEPVGSPRDVREALAAIDAGATVEVKVNRRCEERSLTASKPKSAGLRERDGGDPEDGGGTLRRRR